MITSFEETKYSMKGQQINYLNVRLLKQRQQKEVVIVQSPSVI